MMRYNDRSFTSTEIFEQIRSIKVYLDPDLCIFAVEDYVTSHNHKRWVREGGGGVGVGGTFKEVSGLMGNSWADLADTNYC